MSYTNDDFAADLEKELVNGYDTTRIARMAFSAYHEHCRDISPDLYKIMFGIIAMEEGPEFELSEQQLRDTIARLKNSSGHESQSVE